MRYTEEERLAIKNRIVELLRENGNMRFGELSNILIDEGLVYTSHVVAHTLQNGCKEHERFKGEDLFVNPKYGVWGLVNNNNCIFCDIKNYILENELAYAIFDRYPVNKGHMLFIPKRHVKNFFDITNEERESIFKLIDEGKKLLDEKYSPNGYNIGINCGEEAGQTIMHAHVHLIPRYKRDIENPRGGVRGVIPNKMKY